ncbi:MFS transporter [Trinickia dinghuensis]|uniref:MFS transporter n=1 Tax=Trinickia dinghuensis TaxID=2291023 RepID=A0A3D8K5M3_9BURK|nr:MFS transporter [Trinickia dinghuensis]RDV00333.1 MFS transporter [Trinickia dinghuensis]
MEALDTSMRNEAASNQPVVKTTAYRWLVLAFAWGALLLTFVDRLAWGNLAVPVGHALGMSLGALGIFVTAFYVGYVVSNVAGGIGTDLLGPRRTLALSLVPLGIGCLFFGHVSSLLAGIVVQILMGLAAGCDYSACVKLTTTWFDVKARGRAIGLLMTATSLAVVLTNAIVPKLLQAQSWTRVYEQLGLVTALFGLCCFFVVRDGPLLKKASVGKLDLRSLVRNRDLLLLAFAGFGSMWGTWGFAFWANALMMKGYGLSGVTAGTITVLFGIGAIVSKPLIGLVSDWLGGRCKLLVMICLFGFAASLLTFGRLHTVEQFRLIAPLLGVFAFAYSPLLAVMVAQAAGPSLAGSATGGTNAFWQLGSVVVPLAVGAVFASTHSFFVAFLALSAGPASAFLCMIPIHDTNRR